MSTSNNPRPVFDIQAEHGEGPIWDVDTKRYYWVDLLQGIYFEGNPVGEALGSHKMGQPIGVMALRNKGGIAVAIRDGFGVYDPEDRVVKLIEPSPEQGNPEVRFNDGSVGPKGRFFAGTMAWDGRRPVGKLFRLDPDHSWHELDSGLRIPNGMGWSLDGRTFFMIDTLQHVMFAYEYNLETGELAMRRVHMNFADKDLADGMCIDSQGCFWIAFYGAGQVRRYSPEGQLLATVEVPVPYTTSCCLGGKDLTQLFITTSRLELDEETLPDHPLSGRCFVVEVEVPGREEMRFGG